MRSNLGPPRRRARCLPLLLGHRVPDDRGAVALGPHGAVLVEGPQPLHLVLSELEIEEVVVLAHALLVHALGHDNDAAPHVLAKQGTDLNQLMKFLNTNGADSYDSYRTRRALTKELETFEQVANALAALRKEMAKHGVILSEGEGDVKE